MKGRIMKEKIFLWRVSRQYSSGYDEYSAFVVASRSEALARHYHPSGNGSITFDFIKRQWIMTLCGGTTLLENDTWPVAPDDVVVEKIGVALEALEAQEGEIILSSFNAG